MSLPRSSSVTLQHYLQQQYNAKYKSTDKKVLAVITQRISDKNPELYKAISRLECEWPEALNHAVRFLCTVNLYPQIVGYCPLCTVQHNLLFHEEKFTEYLRQEQEKYNELVGHTYNFFAVAHNEVYSDSPVMIVQNDLLLDGYVDDAWHLVHDFISLYRGFTRLITI